jgi:hypothetical protein
MKSGMRLTIMNCSMSGVRTAKFQRGGPLLAEAVRKLQNRRAKGIEIKRCVSHHRLTATPITFCRWLSVSI